MDQTPSFEQLTYELVLSIALCSAVALGFVLWREPLAYVALGFLVASILLGRRLATRPDVPAWVALAIVPIETLLWPTAVVGDVRRAHAGRNAGRNQTTTTTSAPTDSEDGPGSHTDQER